MAIIYSYPLNTPKRDDLLIGTITYDEDAVNPVHGNPTEADKGNANDENSSMANPGPS